MFQALTDPHADTVLVVEYGEIANSLNTSVPGLALRTDQSQRTWAFPSTPQTHLANRSAVLPLGSVVGGGSVINGMAYTRGSAADYDTWEALGNDDWNWENLYPYFQKSTTFTPPPQEEYIQQYGFEWTPEAYGNGPLQVGFASWQWPASKLEALALTEDVNFTYARDGADGDNTGLIWVAQTVSSFTGERSSAGTAYYNPIGNRTNLHLLTRHYAAEIDFSGRDNEASGVQINSRDSRNDTRLVASSNVILAAGAINTPKLLQLSGIGPKKLLESLDIDVVVDAPVGANFQDHPAVYLSYEYGDDSVLTPAILEDPEFYASAWAEYLANRTGPFTFGTAGRIVFASLRDLDPGFDSVADTLTSSDQLDHLPPAYAESAALTKGYQKQLEALQSQFLNPEAGVIEISSGGSGAVSVALQKPLSRGTVFINNSDPDPSMPPLIDFNAGANPIDLQIVIRAIRKVREFMSAESLSSLNITEAVPGAAYETDEQLEAVLRQSLYGPSFAHPAGTAAMMPRDLGGVVNNELGVYGTEGLWVIDASIMPILPAAHTQATVYAVAEYAADIIQKRT